ncbi:MAG: HAMP domain-containing protein, partial [Proteobacteria bacterium]|nr:HAMP domain-containing protein [Pseudomonadota bacterium]
MSIRISLIIIAVTLLSYWHVMSNLELQVIEQLDKYIVERGHRDSNLFKLAEDNQALFKKEYLARLKMADNEVFQAQFEQLFVKLDDGTTRLRPEFFHGAKQSNGSVIKEMTSFIPQNLTISPEFLRQHMVAYDLVSSYGPVWSNRFLDIYTSTPQNTCIVYFPEVAWASDMPSDYDMTKEEYVYIADTVHNPSRETVWTGTLYDPVSKTWMVSCETPIDVEGQHVLTVGVDILLNELLERTINDHIEGNYNMIFRDDARLIAHHEKMADIQEKAGLYDILQSTDQSLIRIFQLVKEKASKQTVIDDVEGNNYLAVTKIVGPDWYFVTVYPKSLLAGLAFDTACFILFLGVISLLIEITVLFLVLRKQVAQPLQKFLGATQQIATGNFNIEATQHLPLTREDEIGELAHSFNNMAGQLKTSFDTLDAKVIERTAQLDDKIAELIQTRKELVESEKMASLGGLVAGVAHEINTPIGIGVTAASTLADRTIETATLYTNKQLKGSALTAYFNMAQSSSNLVLNNLNRAAELIQSFKQVAVDQSNLDKRIFAVKQYIETSLLNLKPHLKKTLHKVTVNGYEQIEINSYPGAFSQIITNLVMNSLNHAYPVEKAGNIVFEHKVDSGRLILEYSDDGCGIPPENLDKIFEPFFTTARI